MQLVAADALWSPHVSTSTVAGRRRSTPTGMAGILWPNGASAGSNTLHGTGINGPQAKPRPMSLRRRCVTVRSADGPGSGARRRIAWLRQMFLVALASWVCAACNGEGRNSATLPSEPNAQAPVRTVAIGFERRDPCSLLKPAEVEAVLGALDDPPYLRTSSEGDRGCVYEARDLHAIELAVVWTDGAAAMQRRHARAALGKILAMPDGAGRSGAWDAVALEGCCRIDALRDGSLVSVDVLGSDATIEQATMLAERALQRLASPLAIDGEAGIPAAVRRDKARPAPVAACSLLDPRDVQSVLGGTVTSSASVDHAVSTCGYQLERTPAAAVPGPSTTSVSIRWRGGYRAFRQALEMPEAQQRVRDASGLSGEDRLIGPWERVALGTGRILAVKRDVLITVESDVFLGHADHAVELAAAVAERIH